MNNKQNGVAIIGVLVIVALMTAAIAFLLQKQSALFESTKLNLEQDKVNNYFYGLESLAKVVLKKNFDDKKNPYDSLNEEWATELMLPIPEGYISGKIIDQNSKLNIKQIFIIKNNTIKIKNTPNYNGCLVKLSQSLGIPRIDDAIIDYLRNQGEKKLPTHISDLKKMIDAKSYQKIKPFIYINNAASTININTASKQIIMCLHPNIDEYSAKNIQAYIKENKGIKSDKELKNVLNTEISNLTEKQIKDEILPMLSIRSNYFSLVAEIKVGDSLIEANSVLYNNAGKIKSYFKSFNYKL